MDEGSHTPPSKRLFELPIGDWYARVSPNGAMVEGFNQLVFEAVIITYPNTILVTE